jgi:hypothetical protein
MIRTEKSFRFIAGAWVVPFGLAALACVGCVGAPPDEASPSSAKSEPVGETAEAFTNGWYFRTWFAATDFDTGLNPAYWTCFLAGAGGVPISGPAWGLGTAAYAGAMIENGTWHHVARNGFTGTQEYGATDMGSAIMCVPAPAKVAPTHWVNWGGTTAAQKLASASDPNLVCGLTAIENGAPSPYVPWNVSAAAGLNAGSSAYVFPNSGYWWIGGAYQAEAWASCVDRTPGTTLRSFTFTNANGKGTSSEFFQADIGTTQCFLSGFGASFPASFAGGWPGPQQQGIWIGYDFSNLMWTEATAPTMSASVYCIQ